MHHLAVFYTSLLLFFADARRKISQKKYKKIKTKTVGAYYTLATFLGLTLFTLSSTVTAGSIIPHWLSPAEALSLDSLEEKKIQFLVNSSRSFSTETPSRANNTWDLESLYNSREMHALQQRVASHRLAPDDRSQWLMVFQQRLQDLGMNDINTKPLPVDDLLDMLEQSHLLPNNRLNSKKISDNSPLNWLKNMGVQAIAPLLKQDIRYGATHEERGLNYGIDWHTRGIRLTIQYRM